MKNTPELAEEARDREVEPHGAPRYGEMKRAAFAVNLGGIAEDVFRPIGGRGIFFCFA